MKKITQLALLLLLQCGHPVYPQSPALGVGDVLPELTLQNVYNYHSDTLQLSRLKGKLVILDFWNTICLPCLKAFPKIDSLQRFFSDDVQFIAVSTLGFAETASFFDTRPFVHRPDIPFVTGDSVLHSLFPHVGVPYQIWIDKEGSVRYLTKGEGLTVKNIGAFLSKQDAGLGEAESISVRQTLLDTAFEQDVAFASYLVKHRSHGGVQLIRPQTPQDFTASGSIQTLYQFLYSKLAALSFNPFQPGRTQLEVSDPSNYIYPFHLKGADLLRWMNHNYYHYQCKVPETFGAKLFETVKMDFERYFSVRTVIEKRQVDCLVLVRTDSTDRLATKGGAHLHTFFAQDIRQEKMDSVRHYINGSFAWFSRSIGAHIEHLSGKPFFDETGYDGNVDITFSGHSLDAPSIAGYRQELRRYGLDLIATSRQLDVLVLKDN